MKDTHFLYGIATIAVLGILTCFVLYATGGMSLRAPDEQVRMADPSMTKEKKNCHCCGQNLAKLNRLIQQKLVEEQSEKQ